VTPTDPHRSTLTSAASMRVLAHPTRLRLLGLLRERGPQTAAQLGDVVDEAPGTVSYHLAKLASIDLIEPADAQTNDRRERWWKAAAPLTSWDTAGLLDDPDKTAASSALLKSVGQAYAARFADYVDSMPTLPRAWVEAGTSSDRILRLTVDELAALTAELEALVARYAAASEAHGPSTDDGAEPISVSYQAYRRP
jgi:DNA-binding transcriptional ArsR family regulator